MAEHINKADLEKMVLRGLLKGCTAFDGTHSIEGYIVTWQGVARENSLFGFERFVDGKRCMVFYRFDHLVSGGIFNAIKDEKYPCDKCLAVARTMHDVNNLIVTLW